MKPEFLRLIVVFLGILTFPGNSRGQNPSSVKPRNRIKILILGTFHFGETTDRAKTEFPDLESEKRQREILDVVGDLARFQADKIFVENEPSEQGRWDGILQEYKNGLLKIKPRNEIFQIGVRLAAKLNQPHVFCIDSQKIQLDYGKIQRFEADHKSDESPELNSSFFNLDYPLKRKAPRRKLADSTLENYYVSMNSPDEILRTSYDYTHYAIGYGKSNDYTGSDFTADWYKRNIYMFTNILRNSDVKDKRYFLLVGAGHVYILKHLFESNPNFEVVNVKDFLGRK